MIDIQMLLNIGNIAMLIGTLRLIVSVIKYRNILKGYDPIGSSLTLCGMICFNTFYAVMGFWFSLGTSLFTTSYWALASLFSIKNRIREWKEQKKQKDEVRW
jgi:hypothetical protein